MQSSGEQPLVGEERYVTTLITAAKETTVPQAILRPGPPFNHQSPDSVRSAVKGTQGTKFSRRMSVCRETTFGRNLLASSSAPIKYSAQVARQID